eukprot:scaffold923_cov256-Pinguiococcus_pyrenoidosus.AAC.40
MQRTIHQKTPGEPRSLSTGLCSVRSAYVHSHRWVDVQHALGEIQHERIVAGAKHPGDGLRSRVGKAQLVEVGQLPRLWPPRLAWSAPAPYHSGIEEQEEDAESAMSPEHRHRCQPQNRPAEPNGLRPCRRRFLVLFSPAQLVYVAAAPKERSQKQQLREHATGAPHIHRRSILLRAVQQLRRAVPPRRHRGRHAGVLLEDGHQPKVRQLHHPVHGQQQVARLDVPMQQPLRVQVLQGVEHAQGNGFDDVQRRNLHRSVNDLPKPKLKQSVNSLMLHSRNCMESAACGAPWTRLLAHTLARGSACPDQAPHRCRRRESARRSTWTPPSGPRSGLGRATPLRTRRAPAVSRARSAPWAPWERKGPWAAARDPRRPSRRFKRVWREICRRSRDRHPDAQL